MTNLFGAVDSKYSQYFDLSGNFDTGVWGLTVNAHVGRQTVRNVDNGSYTDWKLGLTRTSARALPCRWPIWTPTPTVAPTPTAGPLHGPRHRLLSLTKTF